MSLAPAFIGLRCLNQRLLYTVDGVFITNLHSERRTGVSTGAPLSFPIYRLLRSKINLMNLRIYYNKYLFNTLQISSTQTRSGGHECCPFRVDLLYSCIFRSPSAPSPASFHRLYVCHLLRLSTHHFFSVHMRGTGVNLMTIW